MTYAGAARNVATLVEQGVAEEQRMHPKLIRSPGVLEALRLG